MEASISEASIRLLDLILIAMTPDRETSGLLHPASQVVQIDEDLLMTLRVEDADVILHLHYWHSIQAVHVNSFHIV